MDKDKKEIFSSLRQQANRKLMSLQSEYETLRAQKIALTAETARSSELLDKALLEKETLYQKLTSSNEELLEVSRANTALRMTLVSLDPGTGGYESELKSWVVDLQKKVEVQRDRLRRAQEFIKKLKIENESLRQPSRDRKPKVGLFSFYR